MPVFNEEKFIDACINSIKKQSFQDWELIAIDDFSTDRSKQILIKHAASDPRIQCLSNTEKGIIPALALAFSKTKGTLITRMDADDIMPPLKLQSMIAHLTKKGHGHIVTAKVKYFSDAQLGNGFTKYQNWLNQLCEKNNHFEHIYKECVIPSACWMAHKSDLDKISAFTTSQYPEDYDLAFRFYKARYEIAPLHDFLHLWRDHPARASRNDPNYADQNFFPLKLLYFLELDYDPDKVLIVWGAGKKGKALARLLQEAKVPFHWISNNPNKIARDIYGLKILNIDFLNAVKDKQTIICISDQKFVADKMALYRNYQLNTEDIFEFC